MTSRDVGVLSCRIMSIYVFMIALSQLNNVLILSTGFVSAMLTGSSASSREMAVGYFLASATSMLIMLSFCAFLWSGASYLARLMVPDSEERALGTALSAKDLQVIAFSVVGLLLVAKALPDAAGSAWRYVSLADSFRERIAPELQARLFRLALQFVIGLGLFFGARGLARMWRKLHGLGWEAGPDEGAKG